MVSNGFRAMRSLLLSLSGAAVLAATLPIQAQTNSKASAPLPLITQQIDNGVRVTLHGSVSPMAKRATDLGVADNALQAPRMQLMLQRPADREAALRQYIADIHNKNSASYHKWLTPDQIARQYGPADSDVQAVTGWLQSQGFTVNKISRAKSVIEFGGSAAQIQTAFNTSIHKYQLNGEIHYANATNPQIPAALAPVVRGIVRLNDFRPKSQAKLLGTASYSPTTHRAKAQWNYPENGGEIFLVDPGDFAVQYDTTPLASAGTTGTGVTIGIIQDSNIDLTLVNAFRSLFNLPANAPQVIVDGTDPGINGDAIEAYLDVEWSGAVAPAATVNMYTAAGTSLSAGLDLAAARAVDDDTAQILSLSFGTCEYEAGSTENAYYNSLWEQAAAQGQTVMVSSGDSGSEGCDPYGIDGLAVNALAVTPFNVSVGGTDFYYSDYASSGSTGLPPSFTNYWSDPSSTTSTPSTTITTRIPEQPWNDSEYGFNIAAYAPGSTPATFYEGETAVGGGGGASACFNQTDNSDGSVTCLSGVAKPSFQSALTPADSVRDQPDVSLFAANGYNYSATPICGNPGDCNTDGQTAASGNGVTVTALGGTSVAAPSFAGIMALVVQKYGAQGQADYTLYPLAKQYPAAFHDITAGSNNEPCNIGETDLTNCTTSSDDTVNAGDYSAATGYDLASGLGTVDANVLVTDWNKVTFTGTSTTLTLSSSTITHGATETLTATVTGATSGDVAFVPSNPVLNDKGENSYNASTTTSNFATVGSNGVATLATNTLPGGTYTITADYAGNGSAGTSQSTAQSITVNPEPSNINLVGIQTQVVDNAAASAYVANGTTYPYGTAIAADIQPVGTSVTQASGSLPGTNLATDGLATGTATFTDTGGAGTATVALNAQGIAEWSTGTFGVGSHSISAKYSGDPSFEASSSATPITFTIAKGTPLIFVQPSVPSQGNQASQQIGANMTVQVIVSYLGVGAAPTGTVTVAFGSQTVTGVLTPFFYAGGNYSATTVVFPAITAGTIVNATYNGDNNWNTATGSASVVSASGSFLTSTTALTVTPSTNASNATTLTFSATVTGTGSTPTGTVTFLANASALTDPNTGAQQITLSSSGTASITLLAADLYGGPNQFFAVYSGDSNYAPSSSSASITSIDQSDFTLASQNQVLNFTAAGTQTATVNLGSLNGFNNTVNLTCNSPSSNITCSINPASVTVNGSATAAITITVGSGTTAKNDSKPLWYIGATTALACVLLFGIPARRRSWRALLGLLLFGILVTGNGCGGGGSSSGGGGGGGTTQTATPVITPGAGTYAGPQAATISDATSGASIYYTTDGSTPSASSTKYTAPVAITATTTINAIAIASGDTNSAVATAALTITPIVTQTGTNPTSHNVAIQVVTPSGTSTVVVTGTVPAS